MDLTELQKEAIERARRERKAVPKMLRQYAKRYAKKQPADVLSMHARFDNVPTLDHGRDRAERLRRFLMRAA